MNKNILILLLLVASLFISDSQAFGQFTWAKDTLNNPVLSRKSSSTISESTSKLQWDITRKVPYLIYNGNTSEMQVLWQLISTVLCTIEWGDDTTYSTGSAQTSEYGDDHQHSYIITDLQKATKYFYRVVAIADTHSGSFRTAPDSTAKNIKFFAYGDTRSNPNYHNDVASRIISTFTSDDEYQTFILSVGDLVYNGDLEADWDNQFFNPSYINIIGMLAHLPYQSCMGNHEKSGLLFQKYFSYPFVNGRYWSFDYGPAHFVVVDQYTNYQAGSTQLNWIENDLASTQKPWKFVILHEPGWSAGGHSNNTNVKTYIQPLCEKYNVAIVFAGHNHYYARAIVNGIQHITTGGGGAPLYDPDPTYPYVITTTMVRHFCKVEIIDDLLICSVIKEDGGEIDHFVLNKYGIRAENVSVNKAYQKPGIDTLLVASRIANPYNLPLDVKAIIESSNLSFADTIQLYDDGTNNDTSAGDGTYGGLWPVEELESIFNIHVSTFALDSGYYSISKFASLFSTIGPLSVYRYEIISPDTVPNHEDRLDYKLTLRNEGQTATATNVTTNLKSLDSCAAISGFPDRPYGDIAPGATALHSGRHTIIFSENCPDSIYAQILVEISSDFQVFWSDTFSVFVHKDLTGLTKNDEKIPSEFALKQNYPNPFNPSTKIKFALPKAEEVKIEVYNTLGQNIETLLNQHMKAGYHEIEFNAQNLSSGIYFYRFEAGEFQDVKKMILLR